MKFLLLCALSASAFAGETRRPASIRPLCSGDYSDEMAVLSPAVRAAERDPSNQYSFCLRTTATYECLSYASDGSVRRARKTTIAHGTAFAYRKNGADTLLVTNDHVASWPAVTDADHLVEDVPAGCKMVTESLKVVDDVDDGYEANDIAVTRVVDDPTLDIAILKTRAPLRIMPYRLGRSAALHVGNVVAVHGFPLGAFQATNTGKVVNTYDRDTTHDWDHVDFVTDALLSSGNSGSPVLAVSCRTGEYELVGIYHAGYINGSALNVVVKIDEVRDLMLTLHRSPRVAQPSDDGIGPVERAVLVAAAAAHPEASFFPFGNLVALLRVAPGRGPEALLFEVYTRAFPLRTERLLVVEDLPRAGGFGAASRVYVGNRRGLKAVDLAGLDVEGQAQLSRVMVRLRSGALSTLRYRALEPASREGAKRQRALERTRERAAPFERDAAQSLVDLADRLGPKAGETAVPYVEAASSPAQSLATK